MNAVRLGMVAAAMACALAGGTVRPLAADAPSATTARVPAIVTRVCASCHGRDGNSGEADVPSLAGQGRDYLRRQLAAFRTQRRVGVMSGIAAALDDADARAAADYFAQQVPAPVAPATMDASRRGEAIYREGIAARGVPACASCHALDGSGLPPRFPRLAGQHAAYVAAQLRAFRSGERIDEPDAMMRAVAAGLGDADIDACARYIARMR
jgi:cytochrome c553